MNAAAEYVAPERIHGLDRSALEHKLNDWGNWTEEHSDFEGHPRSDAITAWLEGAGGGKGGHRILIDVMPARLWSIHQRIQRLPEHERDAVFVWYVPTRILERPTLFTIVDLDRDAGGDLPRRWEGKRMFHEVDRPASSRFAVYFDGGRLLRRVKTSEEADTLVRNLRKAEERAHGRLWTTEEKAERLGCSVDAIYQRLHRARMRILGVLPLFVGFDRQSEVK